MKYTHHNNELTLKNLGEQVYLKGWVAKVRNLGALIFIDLRDRFGITQLVVKPEFKDYALAEKIRNEYVIEVQGVVIERESKNKNILTGEIEVEVTNLNIFSTAETTPIQITNETDALEETRLKYRYLDLRRPRAQKFLIQRHHIMQQVRSVLVRRGFYELETPMLGLSTPEGARDYLVPSRLYPGHFYALPQSPQMYKQLFMVAGFEKYFQFAKCFRDEDLRADRQPEFTQVDIEASFIDEEDIFELAEDIIKTTFKNVLNLDIPTPFLRMSYNEAMDKYGSDKPDMRFEMLLENYSFLAEKVPFFENEVVKGFVAKGAQNEFTRKRIDELTALVKKHHGKALAFVKKANNEYSGSIAKFLDDAIYDQLKLDNEDILFLVPGTYDNVSQSLGTLRIEVARQLGLIDENRYSFLWVVDWPLLEYSEDEGRFYAKHHPFTAAKDFNELKNNPKEALAKAYDVVLNGYELGGGSIRIHNQEDQALMFETLGFSKDDIRTKFGFFVDALKYGTPPHGGIALGFDRLVMLMTKTDNIKDVIAFPKTQSAKDQMTNAPGVVEQKQLNELKIKVGE
ncbi:MAG TPA: aspartate--tRNA ligase [Acholeplasma sp.]|jgi:aspartyl-tRNA synthetase|nr:aspartate--tRNA ligase [Acholeplasma sp.]